MNTQQLVPFIGLIAGSIVVSFVLSSLIEWFLHAKILHGEEREGTPAFERHKKHHSLHPAPKFQNAHSGETYGIAPRFFVASIALLACVGYAIGILISSGLVTSAVFGLTAALYFKLMQFVHRRVHEPKGCGWFERTTLYRRLTRNHQVHHARDDRNFCILLPEVSDRLLGTMNGHIGAKK